MLCAGQRGYCQCQGVGGHLADISKASVVYLLVAAHFVQRDNLYRGRIVEFRHRRVVESDMAVFTDAHEYNVDWRLCQQPGVAAAFGLNVGRVAVQIAYLAKGQTVEHAGAQKVAEALGRRCIQAHIFIHVECGNAFPVDIRRGAQCFQKFILRRSSGKYGAHGVLLRQQTAELIFNSWSGLRIPKQALRMEKSTYTDKETGQEVQNNRLGVYALLGGRAEFKTVEVVTEGDDYYVVRSTTDESDALRAGDEVIVRATELYNGQLLEY